MLPTTPKPTSRPRPHRAGFTMVEILIVISIAAVIMSAVAGGAFAVMRASKINRTTATLKVLQSVMDDYKATSEVYPVFSASTLAAAPTYWPPTVDGTKVFLGVVYYGETVVASTFTDPDKVAGKYAIGSAREMLQGIASGNSVFDRNSAIIYDAWQHPIFVSTAGTTTKHGKFKSAGPDGIPNNSDDITSEGGSQ